MFDLPVRENSRETFTAEFPGLEEDWTVGAIVGPSGSGKTTLARHTFGDALWRPGAWPEDQAVIDGFGDLSIKQITHLLTAVGLSSPPTWIKPYRVLSNGEKFRCDLAQALASAIGGSQLIVFDEFTSVVDRTVARIGSAAVAKAIRTGRVPARFVAVTCHYDVLDWLEVDWHVDLADGRLHRRRLRRPEIRVRVVRCAPELWPQFARHHYLNHALPAASVCYAALWDENAPADFHAKGDPPDTAAAEGRPVAFCAVSGLFGARGVRRISRIVVRPEYQGVGLGARLLNTVAAHHAGLGHTVRITTSHPAMLAYLQRAPEWRTTNVYRNRRPRRRLVNGRELKTSAGRCVASFEYRKET
jgi:GNAT superfamily N-acetyltransferase